MLVKGGPGLTFPYHPWAWLARQMANTQTATCLTYGLWIHKLNLMKIFFIIFLFLIIQSCHYTFTCVIKVELSWRVQNCDLIRSFFNLWKQCRNLPNLNCEDIECVEWIPWINLAVMVVIVTQHEIPNQTTNKLTDRFSVFCQTKHDISHKESSATQWVHFILWSRNWYIGREGW